MSILVGCHSASKSGASAIVGFEYFWTISYVKRYPINANQQDPRVEDILVIVQFGFLSSAPLFRLINQKLTEDATGLSVNPDFNYRVNRPFTRQE